MRPFLPTTDRTTFPDGFRPTRRPRSLMISYPNYHQPDHGMSFPVQTPYMVPMVYHDFDDTSSRSTASPSKPDLGIKPSDVVSGNGLEYEKKAKKEISDGNFTDALHNAEKAIQFYKDRHNFIQNCTTYKEDAIFRNEIKTLVQEKRQKLTEFKVKILEEKINELSNDLIPSNGQNLRGQPTANEIDNFIYDDDDIDIDTNLRLPGMLFLLHFCCYTFYYDTCKYEIKVNQCQEMQLEVLVEVCYFIVIFYKYIYIYITNMRTIHKIKVNQCLAMMLEVLREVCIFVVVLLHIFVIMHHIQY